MKDTIIIVPGLFGGLAKKHYEPLVRLFGANECWLYRAGSDWDPEDMAQEIRQIEGNKKVICLSLGAMVGNLLAYDEDTEVYYICPFLGREFINRSEKPYAYYLRHFFKGLALILMFMTRPFKWHCWYPLFGGTKPDGHFLSVYAICKQLNYAFGKTPDINPVTGTVFSYDDTVVEPTMAEMTSDNFIAAWRKDGKGPFHINLRMEGESFGSSSLGNSRLSEDAKAYLSALSKVAQRVR